MSDNEHTEYLVPRKINQGYEFAPGWGFRQVGVVAIGILAGGLVGALMHVVRAPIFLQLFPAILLGSIGVLVARPLMDGSTILDYLTAFCTWRRRPKLYLYDWGRDDWPE